MPTGATVAALTTSLPETPGGERNWDYRYTWMRDSTFTLQALHWLNLDWEADEFMQFVADLEPNDDGALQIMYGIDGRRDLTESTLDHLTGYAGARPVRIGNGAFDQRQNDVYGAVLDSILLHTRRSQRLPRRLWPIVQAQAECATGVWREPDQGIWEARGAPQHYVSSKLMCWVALDRAAKLAELRGDPALGATWRATADEIRDDILAHGVSDSGVLRQHYETDALDASTLLAALFGFLPGDDERAHNTCIAIAEELTENGFVLRYRTDETDDGLSGKEGTFLICSFWLVSALAIVGETQRARDLMERLLRVASPLGLYAEEFDTDTGRHLGNFPQAFSHLALIEAAGAHHRDGTEHGVRGVNRRGARRRPRRTASSSSAPASVACPRQVPRQAPVQVTLIDRSNHHLFQPLLYQVATGILLARAGRAADARPPPPALERPVELTEVTGFDLGARHVIALRPGRGRAHVPYDSLIVAAGAGQSYFGHDEFAEWAPGMKTLADALDQRRRIFGAFEMAELTEDDEERQAWLTFAVVGGGPTGVEIAGQIAELSRRALCATSAASTPPRSA